MQLVPFLERADPLPRTFQCVVIARDPSVTDPRSAPKATILRTKLDFPASRLEPGPRGPRLHVVDFDASRGKLTPPADLAPKQEPAPGWGFVDRFADEDDARLLRDPAFRAQNVYAVAAHTLGVFEFALGRPVPWAFDNPQLYLVPTAFEEANAYYSDDDQALYFGYFPDRRGEPVFTCLARDIVAHETTHAILDGLRRRFDVPSLPDQAGFHEGLADVVALLSVLGSSESVAALLGGASNRRLKAADVSVDVLRQSVLLTLGKEFGDALHMNRGGGLRRSIELTPTDEWRDPARREWIEPHRRGEVLAAAVLQTFLLMWTERLGALMGGGTIDRQRAADEGGAIAGHLLQMTIRAIDYCPPVEFEFDDFLAAIVASDTELAPDDPRGYRGALKAAFASFGIEPAATPPVSLNEVANRPSYRNFSYDALRSDPDEAFRFIWENARLLDVASRYYTHVENVRPSVRVGPRGFVVSETVVDYIQELIVSRAELEQLAHESDPDFRAPEAIPADTKVKLWGGGVLIFDEFGALKYHQYKPLEDWKRQARRLDFLLAQGLWDTRGRLGFSLGTPLGQRFALAHEPAPTIGEAW